jgi:hypothetical protein
MGLKESKQHFPEVERKNAHEERTLLSAKDLSRTEVKDPNANLSRLLVLQGFIHCDFVAPAHCDDFVDGSIAA